MYARFAAQANATCLSFRDSCCLKCLKANSSILWMNDSGIGWTESCNGARQEECVSSNQTSTERGREGGREGGEEGGRRGGREGREMRERETEREREREVM